MHKQLISVLNSEYPKTIKWKSFIFWWLQAEGFDYGPTSDHVKFTDGRGDGGIDAVAYPIKDLNLDITTVIQSKYFHSSPNENDIARFLEAVGAIQSEKDEDFLAWLDTCREDVRKTYRNLRKRQDTLRFVFITPSTVDQWIKRKLERHGVVVHDREYIAQLLSHDISGKTPRILEHTFRPTSKPYQISDGDLAKVYVFPVSVRQLAEAYDEHEDRLFSGNIRFALKNSDLSKKVRSGIEETLRLSPEDFLVYHNGITIVASNARIEANGKSVWMERPSIVNGAQSVSTFGSPGLFSTAKKSRGQVIARLIVIKDKNKVDEIETRIAFRSNNQNKVDPSDLMIDAPPLVKLERFLKSHNIFLERKKGAKRPPYCNFVVTKELFVQILAAVDSVGGLADTKRKQELFTRGDALTLLEKFDHNASNRLEAAFWCTVHRQISASVNAIAGKRLKKRASNAKFAALYVIHELLKKHKVKNRVTRLHDWQKDSSFDQLELFIEDLAKVVLRSLLQVSGKDRKNEAAFYKSRESLKHGLPTAVRKSRQKFKTILWKRLRGVL